MLTGTKWFSTLNLKSGFWQVDLYPDDGEDCVLDGSRAVTIHSHALWPLECSSYVRVVNGHCLEKPQLWVMSCIPGRQIMIGHTFQEHLPNLGKMFQQFREAHLKLNLEKCQLVQKEVWYFGHIVSPEEQT
jgi:hypothetical protein